MKTKAQRSAGWGLPLAAGLLALALSLTVSLQLVPSRYELNEGDVARDSIKSPSRVSFISQTLTQRERDLAVARVQEVMAEDRGVSNEQIATARDTAAKIGSILSSPALSVSAKQGMLLGIETLDLSPEEASTLANLPSGQWPTVQSEVVRLAETTMRRRIYPADVASVKGELEERVTRFLPPDQASVAARIAASFVRPNVMLDQDATEQARKAASERVTPVRLTLERGETIIRDGEVATAVHLEKLQAAGVLKPVLRWEDVAGTGLPTAALVLLLAVYLHLYEGGLRYQPRRIAALSIIITATVVAAKLTLPGREDYALLFPLAAAPMLIGSLISTPAAILSTVLLSVAIGSVGMAGPSQFVTVHLLAGLAGCLLIHRAQRLTAFFLAGAGVAGASFLGILAFHLLAQDYEASRLAFYGFLSMVNGGLSSILTLGTLALLGLVFGLDTPIHLMELANPNQKLLRLLAREAPGTYYHCIMTGNLAERAAESIGADALLARVGAYYHDVGKVVHPGAFVENQLHGGKNVHDSLEPSTSARVVAGHVEEGLKLARRHRLPRQVQDIIAQHHAKNLVTYFYHRAREEGETDADSFRYAGPRPQTKEAAIVFLADKVQATAGALKEHSVQALESLVDKTVAQNLADGQLDECDLTLRDLERVKASLKTGLRAAYHPRIEYPADAQTTRKA